MNTIPTTVFTGFIGSGKTTVISHLLDYLAARGEKVIYIKNEIGDYDLDGKMLASKSITTQELLNGCVCCTLVGSLVTAVNELTEKYNPTRFIIESSGAADPVAMALTVSSHPLLYRDGVITIIDVLHFEGYKDISHTAQQQSRFTDLIVFNKVEEATIEQKRAVVGYVREVNQTSPIVDAPKGVLDPRVAFGIESMLSLQTQEFNESDHLHHDRIGAFRYTSDKEFTKEDLSLFIQDLPSNVFRVKGVVRIKDNGIQVINSAFKRVDFLPPFSGIKATKNQIVFIGYDLNTVQSQLLEKLKNT